MPRYPRASHTSEGLSDRVYSELVALADAQPGPVYRLNVGDSYLEPMPGARAQDQMAANHPRLHNYAAVQGEPELLKAIVDRARRRSEIELDGECLQVMSGATNGLAVVCSVLLDPGDEVLLPSPFWPLIRGIILSRGCKPVEIPFYTRLGEADFDPVAALHRALTPRTTAIYLNSPHNPTGHILSDELVVEIGRLAQRHDLWLMTDEVYEDLWYGEQQPANLFHHDAVRQRAVATHSLSKSYAMAGARVGFTHGPPLVMNAIRGAQTFVNYCAPRPLQFAAAHALEHGDRWLQDTRRLYGEAARTAAGALGLPIPAGGAFLFFDAARHLGPGETVPDLLQRCLGAGVLLTPGTSSGRDYESWVRMCFTTVPLSELRQALQRLETVFGPANAG
jgi:N-succinyldiaminopimelate aminotransferase